MTLFYRICVYLLLFLLAMHLFVRYAEANDLQTIKESQCSQGASLLVAQTEVPVDEERHVIRKDLPDNHPCKLSVTLDNCGEVLYMTYFERCMANIKDLPYMHN